MTDQIKKSFEKAKQENRAVFVAYVTAGFPESTLTPNILLALQEGGADIIEVGIPFTDPLADGPTIQHAANVALEQGVDINVCFGHVQKAREMGVSVPIIFMSYYNPLLQYGEEELMKNCKQFNVNGFIVVDLPHEEATSFRSLCNTYCLSFVPLITPATTDERMAALTSIADSFVYVVSRLGVTGVQLSINTELGDLIQRIRSHSSIPLAVGFGVGNTEQFEMVAQHADGVVIGSKIINILQTSDANDRIDKVKTFAKEISIGKPKKSNQMLEDNISQLELKNPTKNKKVNHLPSKFGSFGGQFVPEILKECLDELEQAFLATCNDPEFDKEFKSQYPFIGRPSSLHLAERLTEYAGGAKIWLKREDLNHTGSHKINNALGQILLAKRLGKKRIIAETGAGQHGVATATVCARFGLDCVIYMGAEDCRRQALNVFRMKMLGATVVSVESGSKTLKDAINEAMRDWATNVDSTHYLVGSVVGPHPFPTIVRHYQSVIGLEAKDQMKSLTGRLPDVVMACVGGGSNAMGTFYPFVNDNDVKLIGVEAGGEGVDTNHHSATLTVGTPGVFHGARTYLLQDKKGQITETHSISAGLDYPGVGPEHSWLKSTGRATYVAVNDKEALEGFLRMTELEGIIPALETSHVISAALKVASTMPKDDNILVCVSGRGDKDVQTVSDLLPSYGFKV